MARDIVPIHAFNRGIISARGLGRTDLRQRVGLSAEIQTNYIPRTLGSMTIRPGWEYIAGSNNNKKLSTSLLFTLLTTLLISR